jgi:hypothetical protein
MPGSVAALFEHARPLFLRNGVEAVEDRSLRGIFVRMVRAARYPGH